MAICFKYSNGSSIHVPCYQNLNLLAHAQLEELEIGSRCGGHGICGGDRIQIHPGGSQLSPATEVELRHLSSDELQSGWRLACQCWPQKNDLDIEVQIKI